MYKNASLRGFAENVVSKIRGGKTQSPSVDVEDADDNVNVSETAATEKTPLLLKRTATKIKAKEVEDEEWSLIRLPSECGLLVFFLWLLTWPIRFFFTSTIPDCRHDKYRNWYPLTLIMCIVWIAILSYIVNWMMTIIGQTFSIPDSVMGLTLIAAGTSIPEVVSSVLVVRRGLGGQMGISTSIGSNTFDILICLGLPWFIKACIVASDPTENYVKINSAGLGYSVATLLLSALIFYITLACNRFYLDRKVGFISLTLYTSFLVLASMLELNMFFPVNLPSCPTDY